MYISLIAFKVHKGKYCTHMIYSSSSQLQLHTFHLDRRAMTWSSPMTTHGRRMPHHLPAAPRLPARSDSSETPREIAEPITPRVRLARNELRERAQPVPIAAAESQRLQRIVHQDTHMQRVLLALRRTRKPLDDHPRAERRQLARDPRPPWVRGRGVERGALCEEAHRGVDGGHLVVVREVRVERAVERERRRVGVERRVDLRP